MQRNNMEFNEIVSHFNECVPIKEYRNTFYKYTVVVSDRYIFPISEEIVKIVHKNKKYYITYSFGGDMIEIEYRYFSYFKNIVYYLYYYIIINRILKKDF